jgi:hypothetical protein
MSRFFNTIRKKVSSSQVEEKETVTPVDSVVATPELEEKHSAINIRSLLGTIEAYVDAFKIDTNQLSTIQLNPDDIVETPTYITNTHFGNKKDKKKKKRSNTISTSTPATSNNNNKPVIPSLAGKSKKASALLHSLSYQLQLARTCQDSNNSPQLRLCCLILLSFKNEEISKIQDQASFVNEVNWKAFITTNIYRGDWNTATFAGKFLKR